MLSGEPPFSGRSDYEVLDRVKTGKFEFSGRIWTLISPEAMDFIKKLLEKDPTKRLSATEALNSDWMTQKKRKDFLGEEAFSGAINNIGNFCKMSQFQ
jgi:calcium-dependent protein kinase